MSGRRRDRSRSPRRSQEVADEEASILERLSQEEEKLTQEELARNQEAEAEDDILDERTPGYLDSVQNFITEHSIDQKAGVKLLDAREDVQRIVLDEGPVTGRNTSAIMLGRLKKAKIKLGVDILGVGVATRKDWKPDAGRESLETQVCRFVKENSLDISAEQKLRTQEKHVQQAVCTEGKLTGRNPSAVLCGRIRRIIEAGGRARPNPMEAPKQFDNYSRQQQQQQYAQPIPKAGASHRSSRDSEADDAMADFDISVFLTENGIDQDAETKLRQQPPQVQQAVVKEGPCTGRNPSAILFSRIRRISEQIGSGGRTLWYGDRPPPVEVHPADIAKFVSDNGLDEYAEQKLKGCAPHIQQACIVEGPVTGRNPNAVFIGRIKRVLETHGGGTPGQGPPPGQGGGYAPTRRLEPPPPSLDELVGAFVEANNIDDDAMQRLAEAAEHVQRAVLEEGNISGRNPSAILLSRLRRAEAQPAPQPPPQHWGPPPPENWGPPPPDRWGPPPPEKWGPPPADRWSHPPPQSWGPPPPEMWGPPPPPRTGWISIDPVGTFIAENSLDAGAESALRELPPHVQEEIINEGPVTGTRNPSAVLFTRIKQVRSDAAAQMKALGVPAGNLPSWVREPAAPAHVVTHGHTQRLHRPPQQAVSEPPLSLHDAVEQFIKQNSIDERAAGALYEQPEHVQQDIIKEGITGCRNPSAILLSRIRRASNHK